MGERVNYDLHTHVLLNFISWFTTKHKHEKEEGLGGETSITLDCVAFQTGSYITPLRGNNAVQSYAITNCIAYSGIVMP